MATTNNGRVQAPPPTTDGTGGSRIELRNVEKTYRLRSGDRLCALRDVSFDVAPSSFVSVVGASGCGKSTLLRIIGGLSEQTSGDVLLDGNPVTGPRRDVGVVFQAPELLPWRTVLSNSLIGAEILGLDMADAKRRALELINLVGLSSFENARPAELSGGMQQRNALVRALLHDPKLLLMDEPFGALDALTRETMGLELLRIWGTLRCSVIFVTHSVTEALFLSDTVVVMSSRPGRVSTIVTVDVPRPRDLSMLSEPEMVEKAMQIRELLGASPVGVGE
ncbi:ABC transporter ATP-binding protein [Dactylosporangium sp. CA-092794]|uniref:ABC transporter ATP-binding protein n=1 Tax=Dactylosporangium sp. CA-092794 TaxID=3239929 RepID=UPI003D8DDAE4